MKKTSFKQRQDALNEWKEEASILGMSEASIKKVEKDFLEKDALIRMWEQEVSYFSSIGERDEKDLALDEANEIHNELLESLSLKRIAS
jgi:hypothetical protein